MLELFFLLLPGRLHGLPVYRGSPLRQILFENGIETHWGGRNTRHERAAAVLWLLRCSSSPPRRKSEIPPSTGVAATAQTPVHATGAPLHRPTGHKIICLRLAQNALGRRGRIVRPQAADTASRGENFRTTVLAAVIRFGWPCRAASSSFLERRRPAHHHTMAMPGC